VRRYLYIILFVAGFSHADNAQEGSLNTFNGDGSTVSSNNTTQDDSVSNTYNGAGSSSEMPVGSAISPTYMSNGMDTCLKGSGSSLQTVGVGISNGEYEVDPNCDRRRDAKLLSDLGMKVAAVARMCEDEVVWKSMFMSGTPCPIQQGGRLVVGKRAYLLMKSDPELFVPAYGKLGRKPTKTQLWFNAVLGIGVESNEEQNDDSESVSDKFRSSLRD
jgi:hypothetical protein